MKLLDNYEPKEVFRYFEEICQIPRGSGNITKISDYLISFAKDRNLTYYSDESRNVIIIKEASLGYEKAEPIMLQGHMDMVAVKKEDSPYDMSKEPIHIKTDGHRIFADGTSLGADDGIAIAYGLALLDSDTIKHPRLELVFTTDEETGMFGATSIDLSMLKSKRMINIDSGEEGVFLAGCAGGTKLICKVPVEREKISGKIYKVTIGGLLGGHSGEEIHKERGNANCLLGRLLSERLQDIDFRIIFLNGGSKENTIASSGEVVLLVNEQEELFLQNVKAYEEDVRKEMSGKDPEFNLQIKRLGEGGIECLTRGSSLKIADLLEVLPNGAYSYSTDIPGLVETSSNLGIAELQEDSLRLTVAVRGAIESKRHELAHKVSTLIKHYGGSSAVAADYPGWVYQKNSLLRSQMEETYEMIYGKKPVAHAIHAGLECGIIMNKIPGLDCISIGPDMWNIHTPEESLSIISVERVWKLLIEFLASK